MRSSGLGLRVYTLLAVGVLYAPLVLLVIFSFNSSIFIAFPLKALTFDWYYKITQNQPMLDALMNSLRVALFTSVISTTLAILGARAVTRYSFPGRGLLSTSIMVPIVMPGMIVGVSLLSFLLSLGLPPSLFNIVIGHVLISTPFAFAVMTARYVGIDRAYEEAALDLGETPWGTFWRVTLPLITPGVISSLLLCFLISFDDFLIAFFLTGSDATLPVYIYSQLRFPKKLPEMLALGVCIIAMSVVLIVIAERFRQKSAEEV